MRYYYLIAHLMFFVSLLLCCKPKYEIPDIALITDLITETIKQDSFDISKPINSNLINRYIYTPKRDSLGEYLPMPIRNENGEPFLFNKYFKDPASSIQFNQSDSIFVALQILLNKDIKIDTNRIPDNIKIEDFLVFDYNRQDVYIFLVPLFNKEKNLAIVQYDYRCGDCGYGRIIFFRKIKNQWIKVYRATAYIT
jgi:hypothetical protein